MNKKQELIMKLEEQLKIEENSKNIYEKFVEKIDDNKVSGKIKKIIKDEIEHIVFVKEMLEIVKKYKKSINPKIKGKKEKIIISEKYDSVLVKCKIENYPKQMVSLLKEATERQKVIYISYNKVMNYIEKLLKEDKVSLNNIVFIGSVPGGNGENMNIDPRDLTKLSIEINIAAGKLKNVLVIVDSISAFSTYHNNNTIAHFVASMNQKALENKYRILWFSLGGVEKNKINNIIAPLCDSYIKI